MHIETCRFCRKRIDLGVNYFEFCSVSCCVDYASELGVSFEQAKDTRKHDEIENLEERIANLEDRNDDLDNELRGAENSLGDADDDYSELRAETEERIEKQEKELDELRKLDWKEIKKIRKKETEFNESVYRKLANIKEIDNVIQGKNEDLKKENTLLRDQNLDLLKIIKDLNSHSDRFNALDLEYDE